MNPTNAELTLLLKFRDEATKAMKQAADGISGTMKNMGNVGTAVFKALGGAIGAIHGALRLLRRAFIDVLQVLSPFIAAIAIASQHNANVAEQVQKLQRAFTAFGTTVGSALLPVLTRIADWVVKIIPKFLDFFFSLPNAIAIAIDALGKFYDTLVRITPAFYIFDKIFPQIRQGVHENINRMIEDLHRLSAEMRQSAEDAKKAGDDIAAGFRVGMRSAMDELGNFGKLAEELGRTAILGLRDRFAQMFESILTGKMKAKEALREFALSILTMMAQLIAKAIATAVVFAALSLIPGMTAVLKTMDATAGVTNTTSATGITGLFGGGGGGGGGRRITVGEPVRGSSYDQPGAAGASGGLYHMGGTVRKFHSGGDVPAMLQEGEFVVRRDAAQKNLAALRSINDGGSADSGTQIVNIWNVEATDAASFRAQMQKNADLVEAMFQRAVQRNNSGMRQSVRLA